MRAGALIAAAFALASCVDEPLYDGRFCTEESPCPDGFECSSGTCRRLCAINDECVISGEVCVSGMCTPLLTQADAGVPGKDAATGPGIDTGTDAGVGDSAGPEGGVAECESAADCKTPAVCEDGAAASCEAGRCVYPRISCLSPPGAECTEGDTLFQTYSSIGACNDATGACEYTSMGVPCPDCATTCLEPCAAVTCDDDNGGCRTSGFCMPGPLGSPAECVYQEAADRTECTPDDGGEGVCTEGECVECIDAADCDDLNPCTTDICDTAAGTCSHRPAASACSDGDACTQTDVCMGGLCVGMDPIDCTGGAPECRQNAGSCDPASGSCSYPPSPLGTACSADGNACTDDVCDGAGGCVHPDRPDGSACTDTNACTQTDGCQNGTCVGADPIDCDAPPGQCYDNAGTCDPASGSCLYPASPSTRSCNDGNVCTHTDRCNGSGGCGGVSYSCNDSNVCTSDSCNGSGGCTNTRIAPPTLNPSGGASVGTMDVTLTWSACADAVSYEVDIDFLRSDGTWGAYFTYTNEPANSKTFFPCSNAAPGLPCNGDFRFRVRAWNGSSFGPWSPFAIWHWANCRAC